MLVILKDVLRLVSTPIWFNEIGCVTVHIDSCIDMNCMYRQMYISGKELSLSIYLCESI